MTHPSDDLIILHVSGELPETERTTLEGHLQHCEACARTARELAEMDGFLRGLPPLPLPNGFARRVEARLLLVSSGPESWRRQAVAASLLALLGLTAGWGLARATTPTVAPAIVRNAEGPKFALIFAEDPATWEQVAPAERERRFAEFMTWLRGIGDASVRLGGTQLDDTRGRIVGTAVPAVAPTLALSGFIVIRAASYDDAVVHARTCPIVLRGGQVIVRRLR